MSGRQVPDRLDEFPVLRQRVWSRCNERNKHFMGTFVGREGSGKSWAALSVGELVDPNFGPENVLFSPEELLTKLQEGVDQGDVFVLDEAGVGVGNRSWYDEAQILFNKVLQVIRDENVAVIFTLPVATELDKQARSRLVGYWEMVDVDHDTQQGVAKYKGITVDRTLREKTKIYEKYPRVWQGGVKSKLTEVRYPKPSADIIEPYEERKDEFQDELYAEALEGYEDDEPEEDLTPDEVVSEIQDGDPSRFTSWHGGHNKAIWDRAAIKVEFDLSRDESKVVKTRLQRHADLVASEHYENPPETADTDTQNTAQS